MGILTILLFVATMLGGMAVFLKRKVDSRAVLIVLALSLCTLGSITRSELMQTEDALWASIPVLVVAFFTMFAWLKGQGSD